LNRVIKFANKWSGGLLIVLVSILAYGLMIPWLGLYMDDWTFLWTYQTYGHAGLFNYFSTNRPIWGLLYHLTLPIVGENALACHVFALFWKIIASLAFYWLMTLLWPQKKTLSLMAGLLFAVYPGFLLQPIAITFGHIWIVYAIFLTSNCFTILAFRNPQKKLHYSAIAVFLSLANVLFMEYFLPLEILRLVIIFILIGEPLPFWKKVWLVFKRWLPYLVVLFVVTIYRAFFFKDQTHIYSLELLDAFKTGFLNGLTLAWQQLISALYQSVIFAWVQPFIEFTNRFTTSRMFLMIFLATIVLIFAMAIILYRIIRKPEESATGSQLGSTLVVAAAALLLAGIPFYITGLPVEAKAINSRFTLPFMIGAVIFLAQLLDLIPWKIAKVVMLSLLISSSIGFNLLNANDYRVMSQLNNRMFYQLVWRAPGLKPETLVVTSEQNQYFTYTTLRAELNLVYPHPLGTSYGWIFGRELAHVLKPPFRENTAISIPSIVQDINGNTAALVAFELNGNGCLRFIDKNSSHIPKDFSDYSFQELSNKELLISGTAEAVGLNKKLIGPEPEHDWCYYFEKADLALQTGGYEAIRQYYKEATDHSLAPHEGYELLPFIEGMAEGGDWANVLTLSRQAIESSPANDTLLPTICDTLDKYSGHPLVETVNNTLTSLGCVK
jgi:hypothetical protein